MNMAPKKVPIMTKVHIDRVMKVAFFFSYSETGATWKPQISKMPCLGKRMSYLQCAIHAFREQRRTWFGGRLADVREAAPSPVCAGAVSIAVVELDVAARRHDACCWLEVCVECYVPSLPASTRVRFLVCQGRCSAFMPRALS